MYGPTKDPEAVLRKKNKAGVSHSQILTTPQNYSNKISMVLAQKQTRRSMEQNREPRNKLMLIWSINLQQGGMTIQWGKDSLFIKWCWTNWTAVCKRMKLEHFLKLYTKINSKWIKDLNMRPETIKLLKEIIGNTLFDISLSNIFLDLSPQARATKAINGI